MPIYKLKDEERQVALEKALPGFGHILQTLCKKYFETPNAIRVSSDDGGWEIYVQKSEIEETGKYSPSTWNQYPETQPPEGVWMRVECVSNKGEIHRRGGRFDGKHWEIGGLSAHGFNSVKVTRFRPWDDTEEQLTPNKNE